MMSPLEVQANVDGVTNVYDNTGPTHEFTIEVEGDVDAIREILEEEGWEIRNASSDQLEAREPLTPH